MLLLKRVNTPKDKQAAGWLLLLLLLWICLQTYDRASDLRGESARSTFYLYNIIIKRHSAMPLFILLPEVVDGHYTDKLSINRWCIAFNWRGTIVTFPAANSNVVVVLLFCIAVTELIGMKFFSGTEEKKMKTGFGLELPCFGVGWFSLCTAYYHHLVMRSVFWNPVFFVWISFAIKRTVKERVSIFLLPIGTRPHQLTSLQLYTVGLIYEL